MEAALPTRLERRGTRACNLMASNAFGTLFRVTTWGESHGKAIGAVIDGCPAGVQISEEEVNAALHRRRPGQSSLTSPRAETDQAEIYSGVFEGRTTGAPISIVIFNRDAKPSAYESIKHLYRPGHANYTYLEKYGIFDHRGGGRSSGRETACRVAAGAVASKLLQRYGITATAFIREVGGIAFEGELPKDRLALSKSPIFCPDAQTCAAIQEKIRAVRAEGDSLGGIVELVIEGLPVGLGDPVYEKLEANLAKAMLSVPASKGFELGSGFLAARLQGSEHNDPFGLLDGKPVPLSNFAGGTLGGITTGLPLVCRVAFKPTSSIVKTQKTVDIAGNTQDFALPEGSRHDPCLAVRAVPVVEAMGALIIADALLMARSSRIE